MPIAVPTPTQSKRIAIIGGGTSGLGTLKALLDLPPQVRKDWTIDLFEQRDDIGGIWHPENPDAPSGSDGLPQTPVYPTLKINTVHPTITFPRFPFPPGTPLLPPYQRLAQYHLDFARTFNLFPHINVSHEIISVEWQVSQQEWLVVLYDASRAIRSRRYDHIIVANGHNHYPKYPSWASEKSTWEASGPGRETVHSIHYRDPAAFRDKVVVVVGFGASGWDIASQTPAYASKVYHSFSRDATKLVKIPDVPGAINVPRISRLTSDGIHFEDDTFLATPDPTVIVFATGYELRIPFLKDLAINKSLAIDPQQPQRRLASNLSLIRPLHRQILAVDERFPTNALAFIGLNVPIANGPSSYAQGLFVAHAIADPSWLPGKDETLKELAEYEDKFRSEGHDPLLVGHRFYGEGVSDNYQDDLVDTVRHHSPTSLPKFLYADKPYLEPWRRWGRSKFMYFHRGWKIIEETGRVDEFLAGAETEEDWEGVMLRVLAFSEGLEGRAKDAGVPLVEGHSVLDSPTGSSTSSLGSRSASDAEAIL